MLCRMTWLLAILCLAMNLTLLQAEEAAPSVQLDQDMMKRYLLGLVDESAKRWEAEFEARTTPEQIADFQKQCRERLLASIGGLPAPCPLNAQTTGIIPSDGYTIEKVIFESQPHFHVTALLYLPDAKRFPPPYPGVVVPVGHTGNGKAWHEYQPMGALLALNGMVGLVYDAIDESERVQYQEERGAFDFDRWGKNLHGSYGHQMIGIGSILLGRNTARIQIADTMRAIDYLQTRPEVDAKRIGCTGHSGGGIITAYTLALDDRIQAAAPSCYLCDLPTTLRVPGPGDAEQVTFAALTLGPQPTDFLFMRSSVPTLFMAATRDQYFDVSGAWRTFQYAKRFYIRQGFGERFDAIINDGKHNYDRTQREGVARWMSRWLLGKDQVIVEPEIKLLTDKEAQCTPDGQVMHLPGARSAYDLNEDYEKELAPRRAKAWAASDRAPLLERVRQIAGIRKLEQLPIPRVEKGETQKRDGYRIEKIMLQPEEGILLPAAWFLPEKPTNDRVTLYVHEKGFEADTAPGGPMERMVLDGRRVLAVDLRGTGPTQQTQASWGKIGPGWQDVTRAYCLGRSYVGMRAEDVLIAARYAARKLGGGPFPFSSNENGAGGGLSQFSSDENGTVPLRSDNAVDLVAVGHVGVPALHAAALEPNLFAKVKLSQTLVSWAGVIHCRVTVNQYVNVVQGALMEYDLPNLRAVLGDRLILDQPLDAMGRPIGSKTDN